MATAQEQLDWLYAHITYLEHTSNDGTPAQKAPGQYWPQSEDDFGDPIPELVGLSLQEYVLSVMSS